MTGPISTRGPGVCAFTPSAQGKSDPLMSLFRQWREIQEEIKRSGDDLPRGDALGWECDQIDAAILVMPATTLRELAAKLTVAVKAVSYEVARETDPGYRLLLSALDDATRLAERAAP